jgi:hypothetical protein
MKAATAPEMPMWQIWAQNEAPRKVEQHPERMGQPRDSWRGGCNSGLGKDAPLLEIRAATVGAAI